ncbi:inositol 1,4,5-trisphosphate receptor-interacting protein-like 1 [Rhea pennata]|uniref:inositol 1,4,5-trisphosphate receptor-interacting protein-like 1 n=1 Tax=Rhea pennata TaxID=8795 RepID=UPI002E255D78
MGTAARADPRKGLCPYDSTEDKSQREGAVTRAPAGGGPAALPGPQLYSLGQPRLQQSLWAMAVSLVLILALLGIVLQPLKVSDHMDVATEQQMQQLEEQLSQEMTRLQQEIAEMMQEPQSRFFRRDTVFVTWDLWQLGAFAGGLVLLFGLFWIATEQDVGESDSSSGLSSSGSKKEREGEEEGAVGALHWLSAEPQLDSPGRRALETFYEQHLLGPAQDVAHTCKVVEEMVGNLLHACQMISLTTFLPRLEQCIGMGSVFEGWSHRGEDTVYSLLVPLKPPPGHSFHLKLGTGGELPARHGRVRVKLECTCEREQLLGDVLCFQHHSQIQVRRYQSPGLLHTLCTGFYLDVEKTIHWFQLFVRNAWDVIAAEQNCQLTVLPSSRSCKLLLAYNSGRTVHVEIMLGVQQDDSGVFMGSQEAEASLSSSTTWLESCVLQELLFFRFVARQAPQGSCHLTCLQLLTCLLEDSVLSSVHLKTVTMHLLTLLPPTEWCPEHLLERLRDVLHYLHCCLEEKQLQHFLLGNKRVPSEVPLSAAFQTASPLNLFQHLAQEPDTHAQALREFTELQDRLRSLLG